MFFGGNCADCDPSDLHLCLHMEGCAPLLHSCPPPVPQSLHSRPLITKQNIRFPCLEPSMGLPSYLVFMPVRTLASRHGWHLVTSPATCSTHLVLILSALAQTTPQLVPTSAYSCLFGVCRACYWLPLPSSGSSPSQGSQLWMSYL